MISATQIRAGMILELDTTLYRVMAVTHLTPGNKRGIIQTQLRNLASGNQEEKRFGSDEKVARAHLEQRELEFLYAESATFHFMDTSSYEQLSLDESVVGRLTDFLLPNAMVKAEFHEGHPVGVDLPQQVILMITEAEPTVKKATASATYKQARVETGLQVKVPSFVQVGDRIAVDTTTGAYLERAS